MHLKVVPNFDPMKVLVISDNIFLVDYFKMIVARPEFHPYSFLYKSTPIKGSQQSDLGASFSPLMIKDNIQWILNNFELVISAHCKQIFPSELVESIRCVNVHPGLNPYNRGWFPQVFSIINGLPAGATIHEIDNELDHGPIIVQKEVKIESYDTSLTAYKKVQIAEIELLNNFLLPILKNEYEKKEVSTGGNLNLKKDFNKLCQVDLGNVDTFENHINKLRALTHGDFKNAYFIDSEGRKIFISLNIHPE